MKNPKSIHNGRASRSPKGRIPHRRPKPKHLLGYDDLLGQGAALWNDEEFARFQTWLRETRRE